jgi:hypothetical protein
VTPVDTNVLLDLVTDDRDWAEWSIEQLQATSLRGPLLIKDVVYAELSVRYSRIKVPGRGARGLNGDVEADCLRIGSDLSTVRPLCANPNLAWLGRPMERYLTRTGLAFQVVFAGVVRASDVLELRKLPQVHLVQYCPDQLLSDLGRAAQRAPQDIR